MLLKFIGIKVVFELVCYTFATKMRVKSICIFKNKK